MNPIDFLYILACWLIGVVIAVVIIWLFYELKWWRYCKEKGKKWSLLILS